MITDPLEECPPDDPQTEVTIQAKLQDGIWSVYCPQWKCQLHHKNLTRVAAMLCAEIESHNAECEGHFPVHKDFNAWASKNGMAELRKEAWPKPPPTLRGKKHPKPAPDSGKRTPRVSHWQSPS